MFQSTTEPYQPAISPKVRTVVYVVGLAVATLSILAPGITEEIYPAAVASVENICDTLLQASAFLAGALSVVYRPTAGERRPYHDSSKG